MPRFAKRQPKKLTLDQETILESAGFWGIIQLRGESTDQLIQRIFGGWQEAKKLYFLHEDAVLKSDPIPGRRPWAWWQWRAPRRPEETEQRIKLHRSPASPERPLPEDEAAELGRLNLLEPWEEAELSRWAALKFEPVND